ncbi:hypothetical protein RV18_GL002356 [Enterococcus termitis]|nr:hypothetical protein RV18_GL002356 [Enterococcus termitis]
MGFGFTAVCSGHVVFEFTTICCFGFIFYLYVFVNNGISLGF